MYDYDRSALLAALKPRCTEVVGLAEQAASLHAPPQPDHVGILFSLSLSLDCLNETDAAMLSRALDAAKETDDARIAFARWRVSGKPQSIAECSVSDCSHTRLLHAMASGSAPDAAVMEELFAPLEQRDAALTADVLRAAVIVLDYAAEIPAPLPALLSAYLDKFEVFGRLRLRYERGRAGADIPYDSAEAYALLAVALLRLCARTRDLRCLNCALKLNDLAAHLLQMNLLPPAVLPLALRAVTEEQTQMRRLHGHAY